MIWEQGLILVPNRLWTVPDSFQHSPGLAMKRPPYHTKSMSFVTNSNILQKKYAVSWADFANCFKLGIAFEDVCFVNAMIRNSALDMNRILTWRSFNWPRKLYAGDEIYRLQLKAVFVTIICETQPVASQLSSPFVVAKNTSRTSQQIKGENPLCTLLETS